MPGRVGGDELRGGYQSKRGNANRPTHQEIGPVDPGIGPEKIAHNGTGFRERKLSQLLFRHLWGAIHNLRHVDFDPSLDGYVNHLSLAVGQALRVGHKRSVVRVLSVSGLLAWG